MMGKVKRFDLHDFLKKFEDEYDFLYDNNDNVVGYDEAVDSFEAFYFNNKDFVKKFCEYRGDRIDSKREAAAFMFSLESLEEC